jgi:hypothetical protein
MAWAFASAGGKRKTHERIAAATETRRDKDKFMGF